MHTKRDSKTGYIVPVTKLTPSEQHALRRCQSLIPGRKV